jgi:hypothetical protein
MNGPLGGIVGYSDDSNRNQGSISPTYLRTALTPVAPKSVIIQSSCQYLFVLLGSTGAKAACIMLMKLTQVGAYSVMTRDSECLNQ